MRRVGLLLSLLVGMGPAALCAQHKGPLPQLPAESVQAQTRLRGALDAVAPGAQGHAVTWLVGRLNGGLEDVLGAAALLPVRDEETWGETLDECLRLLRDLGDGLVQREEEEADSTLAPSWISVRRRVALALSDFPLSVRERYRERVEEKARGLLEQARAERSERLLRRLAEEHFCTLAAAEGLELLGDAALTRGEVHEALAWWGMLAALPGEGSGRLETGRHGALRHPDAGVFVARVGAKQVLAIAYLGDPLEAKKRRDAYAVHHPRAEGVLAGVKGKYLTTLDDLLGRFLKSGDLSLRSDWSTLGGAASRHELVPECPSERLWIDGPTWKVDLPPPPKWNRDEDIPFLARPRALYHPVISGDRLLLADSKRVIVYRLATGQEEFRQEWPKAAEGATAEAPAFTASAGKDLVVFRIGMPPEPNVRPGGGKKSKESTWLVGLDLRPGVEKAKRIRWQASVPLESKGEGFFTGPPLFHQGRVWAAYQFWKDGRLFQALGSLSPDSGDWLTTDVIADVPPPPPGREGLRQPALLCAAGSLVVFVGQEGVVAATDAASGRVVWGVRYPSQGTWTRRTTPSTRDLAAPLYAHGRVYVAPQDTDLLLCLDGTTGSIIWEREALDVVQLIGCSQGRLIFTTAVGLRAVSAQSGSDAEGWALPDDGRLATFGRGLILGDWIFWPTGERDMPMCAVAVSSGRPELPAEKRDWDRLRPLFFGPTMLRNLPAGNMAFGQGCLVVAGEKELTAFVRPGLMLEENKEKAEAERTPLTDYRLAVAEAETGRRKEAYERLRGLITVGPKEWQGLGRERLHELLAEWSERDLAAGRGDDAAEWLTHAGGSLFSVRQRAWALQRLQWLYRKHPSLKDEAKASQLWATLRGNAPLWDEYVRWRGPWPIFRSDDGGSGIRQVVIPSEPAALTAPLVETFRAPGLRLLRLDRSAWRHEENLVVATGEGKAVCLDGVTGKVRWQAAWNGELTWTGLGSRCVLLAGPDEIRSVSLKAGEEQWYFPNPARRQDRHVLDGDTPFFVREPGGLGEVHRVDGWGLLVLLGRNRVVLMEDENGLVLWDSMPRAHGEKEAGKAWVRAAGDRALVRLGETLVRFAEKKWHEPPRVVQHAPSSSGAVWKGGRWIVGDARGAVVSVKENAVDPTSHYEPDRPSTLSGQPARVHEAADGILAVIPRNEGDELVFLEPDGALRWRREAPASGVDASLSSAGTLVYVAHADHLLALDAKTGMMAWKQALPIRAQAWRTFVDRGVLIAHPTGEQTVRPSALELFPALALAWQARHRIPCDEAEFFLFEPVHGRLLQRIKLEGGCGPYRATPCAAGLILSNGREIRGFSSAR